MARIRTIKPEFPQSETVGKLSREARLLFILLWTIVDDAGRARASSRMLASLLYPYDDDAPRLIDNWLGELEAAGCVRRYAVDGSHFLDLPNWLKHQKIDKPSASKLPEFGEHSAMAREPSRGLAPDLVPRTGTKDQDKPPTGASADKPKTNFELGEAMRIFNEAASLTGWAAVQRLTSQRDVALRARLAECGGIVGWQAAMDRAKASAFLCGDNDRGWKADFDFICKSKNFTKLMEGGYDRSTGAGNNGKTFAHDRLFGALARAAQQGPGVVERKADPDDGGERLAIAEDGDQAAL